MDLGLSEGESKVYLVSLGMGPATILKISRATDIKRTTIYSIVEALKQKGLMAIEIKGWKKLFVAESPEKLDVISENRRKELKSNLPRLLSIYNLKGEEGFIKYYEGIAGVKSVYERLIHDIKPKDNYMVIADQELWYNLDQKYFSDFIRRRARLNINIRMLLCDSEIARKHKKFERNYNEEIRILPKGTGFTANIIITPQKIVFHQLTQPIMVLVVENKSIIKTHQEIFDMIWNSVAI